MVSFDKFYILDLVSDPMPGYMHCEELESNNLCQKPQYICKDISPQISIIVLRAKECLLKVSAPAIAIFVKKY